MSKCNSIVVTGSATTRMPQAAQFGYAYPGMPRAKFFHRLLPLWIGSGSFLAIMVALFSWDFAVYVKIAVAACSVAGATVVLSIFYYITLRNEDTRKAETAA